MNYEKIPDDKTLIPNHLYKISEIYESNPYWYIYVKSDGLKIFILKELSFPAYVKDIRIKKLENNSYEASFSILFPDNYGNVNKNSKDVIIYSTYMNKARIWYLSKDVEITFPSVENSIFGWFDETFMDAYDKARTYGLGERDVSPSQHRLSTLKYYGYDSKQRIFMDYKVVHSPIIRKAPKVSSSFSSHSDSNADSFKEITKPKKVVKKDNNEIPYLDMYSFTINSDTKTSSKTKQPPRIFGFDKVIEGYYATRTKKLDKPKKSNSPRKHSPKTDDRFTFKLPKPKK